MNSIVQYPKPSGLWAVEFSQGQRAFHIQEIEEAALTNLDLFLKAQGCDYTVVALARSHEEAEAVCDALDVREERERPFTLEEVRRALLTLLRTGLVVPAAGGLPPGSTVGQLEGTDGAPGVGLAPRPLELKA